MVVHGKMPQIMNLKHLQDTSEFAENHLKSLHLKMSTILTAMGREKSKMYET